MTGSPTDRFGARFSARLSPRLRDRLSTALRPSWARSVILRRSAALGLVAAALVVSLLEDADASSRTVLVAAHDLRPGQTLTPDDLTPREVPGGLVPANALRMAADGLGLTVVGVVGSGEILTSSRLLTPRLPRDLAGRRDARLVPVRPADDAVVALLREGDVVDVVTPDARVLARGAVVALAAPTEDPATGTFRAGSARSAPILLAMDSDAALRVAAENLDSAVAIVVH